MSVLSQPQFHNEEAAFAFLEGVLWPKGPVCPHCGCTGRIGKIAANVEKRIRIGLHKCGDCGKQFTVKVGTVFEHARIPLHKMLQAGHLLCSSKKGISSHQLHRILGVQYKTAWFLAHRIREAMRGGSLAPMGGASGFVEADETYFGKTVEQPTKTTRGRPFVTKHRFGPSGKRAIVALVERGGSVRSFHVDRATKQNVATIVAENVSHEAHLRTDESQLYTDNWRSLRLARDGAPFG
jgi:transposase-like protein